MKRILTTLLAIGVLMGAFFVSRATAQVQYNHPQVQSADMEKTVDALWTVWFHGDNRPEILAHRDYVKNRIYARLYKAPNSQMTLLREEIYESWGVYIVYEWQPELIPVLYEICNEIDRSRS